MSEKPKRSEVIMTRKAKKKKRDENSVRMALNDLMSLEDDRHWNEEEEQRAAEAQERARLEEEKIRKKEEEEAARKKEKLAEQATREAQRLETEKQERETRERALRIQAEAEAKARVTEQIRMMEFELEMKRISAGKNKAPAWIWPTVTLLVLGLVGAGAIFYNNIKSEAEFRISRLETESAKTIENIRHELSNAHATAQSARDQLKKAKSIESDLAMKMKDLHGQLEAARSSKPERNIRRGSGPKSQGKTKSTNGLDNLDLVNPIGDEDIPN